MADRPCYLVADIGGTTARFVLLDADNGEHTARIQLDVKDYPDIAPAIHAALAGLPATSRVMAAVLAVAGPVAGGEARLTNSGWHCSRAALQAEFGWEDVLLLNDFEAAAWGIVAVPDDSHMRIGGPEQGDWVQPRALLGPGTGLGVACVLPFDTTWCVLPSEGGHSRFAPGDEEEFAVAQLLTRQNTFLQREDLLSGRGLCALYGAMAILRQIDAPVITDPAVISGAACSGDPFAVDVLNRFCTMLGAVAADVALEFGARGGVYITGGIMPRVACFLRASPFRTRFDQHSQFADYLQSIPTLLVTRDDLGLVGANFALRELLVSR